MFNVNDYVVYGLKGVCHIEDIKKDDFKKNDETEYYVLRPIYNNNITIMIPVNNPNLMMRSVSNKDDVLSLIAGMPEMEPIFWIADDRERTYHFTKALKSGNPVEWIKIIKTIYLEKKARSAVGKKIIRTDEEFMRIAQQNIYEEFAFALNVLPDEVVSYIREHIPKDKLNNEH